jgi:peptidoglycan/xylan/chitin deacetylase (PgdA/CDA1 family)
MEPDCPPYLSTWRGITEGAPGLLDLFAAEAIPVTYFVTGETAERYPESISALVAAGHELACHGTTHRPFEQLSRDEAEWEISAATHRLRGFGTVTSFRAPFLRFPSKFLSLLEDSGIVRDSSVAKYKRDYYSASVPTRLLRIPVSVTSSVLRLPRWIRDPWLLSLASPVVLFVHPWEFVDLTRENLRFDCRFRTGSPALRALRSVVRLFKSRGDRFCRIDGLSADTSPALS